MDRKVYIIEWEFQDRVNICPIKFNLHLYTYPTRETILSILWEMWIDKESVLWIDFDFEFHTLH